MCMHISPQLSQLPVVISNFCSTMTQTLYYILTEIYPFLTDLFLYYLCTLLLDIFTVHAPWQPALDL